MTFDSLLNAFYSMFEEFRRSAMRMFNYDLSNAGDLIYIL